MPMAGSYGLAPTPPGQLSSSYGLAPTPPVQLSSSYGLAPTPPPLLPQQVPISLKKIHELALTYETNFFAKHKKGH